MPPVNSCCGSGDLRIGARNIAALSMLYDLVAIGALLLTTLLHVRYIAWKEYPNSDAERISCYVFPIVSMIFVSIHLVVSFLLLYSTWNLSSRGVKPWVGVNVVSILFHLAWAVVPFLSFFAMDFPAHYIWTLAGVMVFVAVLNAYFTVCVSSYGSWVREREHDHKARRRLREDY